MHVHWATVLSVASPLLVGVLAYLGAQRGIRRQINAARYAIQRDERAEHLRWLRDRAVDAFLAALDLTEAWYDYRRQLYSHELEKELGRTPKAVTGQDPELSYGQVAARLELFGNPRLRQLLDVCRDRHSSGVYLLDLVIRGNVPDQEGPPVPDISYLHECLEAAVRADEEFRAALVEAIQERPSLRLDLAEGAPRDGVQNLVDGRTRGVVQHGSTATDRPARDRQRPNEAG